MAPTLPHGWRCVWKSQKLGFVGKIEYKQASFSALECTVSSDRVPSHLLLVVAVPLVHFTGPLKGPSTCTPSLVPPCHCHGIGLGCFARHWAGQTSLKFWHRCAKTAMLCMWYIYLPTLVTSSCTSRYCNRGLACIQCQECMYMYENSLHAMC